MQERRESMHETNELLHRILDKVDFMSNDVAVLKSQMVELIKADLPTRMTKAEAVTGAAVWMAGTIVTAIFTGIGWVAHKIGII